MSSADAGAPSVAADQLDQHRLPVDDDHVREVEPAVGDPGGVQPRDLLPEVIERRVGDVGGRRLLERLGVRFAGHDQRVALGRRAPP